MWYAVALNQCLVMNQNCSYTKFQERSQKNRVFLTERKISPLLEATVYVRIKVKFTEAKRKTCGFFPL